MLVLWLDILSQFWIEYDLNVIYLHILHFKFHKVVQQQI